MYNYEYIIPKFTKDNFEINGDKLKTVCFNCDDPFIIFPGEDRQFDLEISLEDATFHCNKCGCEGGLVEYLKARCSLKDEQIQEFH